MERYGLKRFKITGIGVYERHKENRTGYHIHLLVFNMPYLEGKFYDQLKKYVQSKLRATIQIDSPSDKIKYVDGRVKIRCAGSMRTYLAKMFNYIKKQFKEKIEIVDQDGLIKKPELHDPYERLCIYEELLEVLPDLVGQKIFVKRGKLLSPKVQRFQTLEEFEIYRDRAIKGGSYKVKDVLQTSNFIPVTFIFLEKTLEKIRTSLNDSLLEFISRGWVGSQERWYCWENKITYTACAGYILKEE